MTRSTDNSGLFFQFPENRFSSPTGKLLFVPSCFFIFWFFPFVDSSLCFYLFLYLNLLYYFLLHSVALISFISYCNISLIFCCRCFSISLWNCILSSVALFISGCFCRIIITAATIVAINSFWFCRNPDSVELDDEE